MKFFTGWLLLLVFMQAAAAHAMACKFRYTGSRLEIDIVASKDEFRVLSDQVGRGMSVTLLSKVNVADATYAFGCKVRPILWEELFVIEPLGGKGSRRQNNFTSLPAECATFSTYHLRPVQSVKVTTVLNPVSNQQIKVTRKWLAEKGIGAGSSRVFGRAVNALINLGADSTNVLDCKKE